MKETIRTILQKSIKSPVKSVSIIHYYSLKEDMYTGNIFSGKIITLAIRILSKLWVSLNAIIAAAILFRVIFVLSVI